MQGWAPLACLLALGLQDGGARTAFVNVNVVSMQDDTVRPGQTVVVEGDRIVSIGPATGPPPDATAIDGTGRYLIPGLADMHVHVAVPFDNGPLFLDAGITTVLNLGTRSADPAAILPERARSRAPEFPGPALYTAGRLITTRSGATPDDAERIVRETVAGGYDLVKVYSNVAPDAFDRLHETARALGIGVTGHAQRNQGIEPVYAHGQDLAHAEEYLYAAFNPDNAAFRAAVLASLAALLVLSLLCAGWSVGAAWRRLRRQAAAGAAPSRRTGRRWVALFTVAGWVLFFGLFLTLTEPFAGIYAGKPAAVALVGTQLLLTAALAAVVTAKARRSGARGIVVAGLAWTFLAGVLLLAPRLWRTTGPGLERIARDTAAAGIWVTPNLVTPDLVMRQATDEFDRLVERPGMRYLRPETRRRWIHDNPYRVPPAMAPLQHRIWRNYTVLLSRLTGKLHDAGVPLLAGSDAVGPPGVLPGSSLHDELMWLVHAGLTPYEALRTATVNAAAYLGAEQEFGRIAEGLRADLVLLEGDPLEDIGAVRDRLGVMKRGRWYSAGELEALLETLAAARE